MSRVMHKQKYSVYPMALKEEVVALLEECCLKEDGRIRYNSAELLARQLDMGSATIVHWLRNKLKYGVIERRDYLYSENEKKNCLQLLKDKCLKSSGSFDQRKARSLSEELGVPFTTLKGWFYNYIKAS